MRITVRVSGNLPDKIIAPERSGALIAQNVFFQNVIKNLFLQKTEPAELMSPAGSSLTDAVRCVLLPYNLQAFCVLA
jgi:hypothetical protein